MKATLTTLTALLICTSVFADDSPSVGDRLREAARQASDAFQKAKGAVTQGAQEAWEKTQAYLSDDPATYREGATGTLQEWGAEIGQLQQQAAAVAPTRVYLQTLLTALAQQREFAVQQLAALTPDQVHEGRDGARRALDGTMHHLEEHLDLARGELRDLIGSK
ncbi:MAG TPA: hypothetical protein VGD78_16510 [Chthoniobacterales bacterium]